MVFPNHKICMLICFLISCHRHKKNITNKHNNSWYSKFPIIRPPMVLVVYMLKVVLCEISIAKVGQLLLYISEDCHI